MESALHTSRGLPAGCCRACVMSHVTGHPASRMSTILRGSTTRSLYPNMVPRSQARTLGLPAGAEEL